MKFNGKKILPLLLASILFLGVITFVKAQTDECAGKSGQDRIDCLTQKSNELSSQAKTLANQIAQYDAQINLTQLKIADTENKIQLLGGRIGQLEDSLNSLSKAFSSRAVETYKLSRFENNFVYILTASDISEAVSRFHYLQKIQEADRNLLEKLQVVQTSYKGQKADQETLQKQLEIQQINLNNQKAAKASLLEATRNDEIRYQQLLSEAIAQAGICLGLGTESYVRDVSEGDGIGSIINSSSGCSSGRHLHFQICNGSALLNPNDYLKSISFSYNYDPTQYGYYGTINPHGSWNWPLNDPITINQGFGATGYAKDFGYRDNIHPGIDMDSSSSLQVKAVKQGKLYSGYIQCGGTFAGVLQYAKIDQGGGVNTYYEHMNVQ